MEAAPLPIDLLGYSDQLELKTVGEEIFVKDPCRKKFLKLEPEEFVRQLMILYLHDRLNVGFGRMISEQKLNNYQNSRFDLGIRNISGEWSLLVECKSFRHPLHQDAVIQLSKYNDHLGARIGMVSNGKDTYAWKIGERTEFITQDSDLLGHI